VENQRDFCTECRRETNYTLKKIKINQTIRGKEYTFEITAAFCNECSGDAPGDEAWTKKIAGMRIYPAAELQRLLEQAGFRRIQIHKTSRWLCLTAQKPD